MSALHHYYKERFCDCTSFRWNVVRLFKLQIVVFANSSCLLNLRLPYTFRGVSQTTEVLVFYISANLATVQIWGQSSRFPFSCNSFSKVSASSEKSYSRKHSAEKNLLLWKHTPPTKAFNWVVWQLIQPALGKFATFTFVVKFIRESPKTRVFSS